MKRQSRYVIVALLMSATTLAGCGGSDPAAPSGDSGTTTATSSSTPAGASDDCGGVAEAVKQRLNSSTVDSVTVVGQCTTVVVATSLADDASAAGVSLCDQAAKVAYTGDINSIRVLAKSGAELSNGITNLPCLP